MRGQKSWLNSLARSARWRLGAKEGEEVIADYREIVGGTPRSEEELDRDLGKSIDAVKLLVDHRDYRVWLAVFILLAACIVIPGTSPLPLIGNFYVWHFSFVNLSFPFGRVPALLGVLGALVWFRRKGSRAEKLPRKALVCLLLLLAWCIALMGVNWAWMHDAVGFSEMWGEMPLYVLWVRIGPEGEEYLVSRSAHIFSDVLEWGGGLGMTVVGIIALVKARTEDRRWAAVYVLAMTAMLVSLETLGLLNSTMIPDDPTWENFLSPYFFTWAGLTAVGLIGTGVALC